MSEREEQLRKAAAAAARRRNPDPEKIEQRNRELAQMPDWKGRCGFCKAELQGTIGELIAHSCQEFEESK